MKLAGYAFSHISVIRTTWNSLKTNRIIAISERVSIILGLLSIVLLFSMWQRLPPEVPFWYSRPWGETQLAHPLWLLLLPLGSLSWVCISILSGVYLTHDHLTFTQILFLTTSVTSILSFITLIQILFLVI